MSQLPSRDLLEIDGLEPQHVTAILDSAEAFLEVSRRPVRKVPTLRGKTVINLFYENSTRTRTSFELAAKRLSADAVNMSVATSSIKKGESLYDTAKTLEAMHPDAVVIRHPESGAPHFLARHLRCAVINAGDGMHAHPTQALLDAFTIRKSLGRISGLKVAICGDIAHSRVARSNCALLTRMGNDVHVVGPRTLIPPDFEKAFGVTAHDRLEPALQDADVVMLLRIQRERLGEALLPSLREYARTFGVSRALLDRLAPNAIVLHPGPMNRGVEIEPELADDKRSRVLDQVEAGVAVRMALLYMLIGESQSSRAPT